MQQYSQLRTQIVDRVRAKINFAEYELDPASLTLADLDQICSAPELLELCWVKTHDKVPGSAYNGMKELAVVGGYMRGGAEQIKALIIYMERPEMTDGVFDFELVAADRVRRIRKEKL